MTILLRPRLLLGLLAVAGWLGISPAVAAQPAKVPECTVILDAATGKTLHREGTCSERFNPFSTFKLPLALIGYDAGILQDEHTPSWDYKPQFKAVKRDQKTVDPTIWEKDSILWFSRQITRRLGEKRFAGYVSKFGYGNADVSGDPGKNNGLTDAWLLSSLKISPDEQADFVRRMLAGQLPVSDKAYAMTKSIIPQFEAKDGWVVHGKTGSGWLPGKDGKPNRNRPLGWFVGWAEANGRQIVFARMQVGTDKAESPKGHKVRDRFIEELPGLMRQ
ncbi:class D beta-lactamase [Pseudaminobacter soli (ex Li et al. 2025)]|uniref:Beta-lactamase n=1 Tax=Pseudaminobacter soli (ex Li et al. 2025) TaxID=1295366 RepID=A0A2P7SCT3_9HYPH|nr:class D beta-lactamase [Mesorhizobium soli]PSJ60324.1 class D beta-lactamase [Mesorhizobium soli]